MDHPAQRILVVDDDPFIRDTVKAMLMCDGYTVKTASSGGEALALFEKGKFDLVITDFAMPEMKGDELATAIKTHAPDQRIVMMTAYAEILPSADNRLADVDFVLGKPFHLNTFLDTVSRIVSDKKRPGESVPGPILYENGGVSVQSPVCPVVVQK